MIFLRVSLLRYIQEDIEAVQSRIRQRSSDLALFLTRAVLLALTAFAEQAGFAAFFAMSFLAIVLFLSLEVEVVLVRLATAFPVLNSRYTEQGVLFIK